MVCSVLAIYSVVLTMTNELSLAILLVLRALIKNFDSAIHRSNPTPIIAMHCAHFALGVYIV